jgi:AraC-like DNA-binding protein
MSRGYLNRLFREAFGMSASVALERLRCSRTEALLTRTDLTIAGYADVTHFSHRFSAVHGLSPSAYRQPREPIILSLGTARRAAAEPTRLGVRARSGGLISRTTNRKTVPRR